MTGRAILVSSLCALAFGCGVESRAGGPDETQEIIDNLIATGYPEVDLMVVDGKVYAGRDAEVSLAASREMLEADPSSTDEQYRTTNLVSRSLAVICVNGAAFSGKFSDALNSAITNYNQLGLTFSMRRTSSSGGSGCGATITARRSSGTGGSAGFPSGGRPYGTINIGSGLESYDRNTVEHVITHELGHTIGLRHSDYFNRGISCGRPGNEGPDTVGAIHISGTPTGATVGGSLMNSCFRSVETGEFTSSDRTALTSLY